MGQKIRLKKLLALVGYGNKLVIDIGADHGLLSKAILDENRSEFVVATDISSMCLKKSEALLDCYIKNNKAKCMVSDGLIGCGNIKMCDKVIIAGMGGNEIIKILSENPQKDIFNRFLLQPMQDADILRRFLSTNGYEIIKDEIIVERNKFYFVLEVVNSAKSKKLDELEIAFGRFYKNNNSAEFISFINYTFNSLKAREKYLSKNDLLKLSFCEKIINE